MRVIKVDEDSSNERWILWMVAGAALGVTAGVLAAEKFSGRTPSAKGLLRRARSLVQSARDQWGPMLALALELKEAFGSGPSRGGRYDEDEDADEFEDGFEAEYADAVEDDLEAGLDVDLDEDIEDDLDEDEYEAALDSVEEPLVGRRVLEAFENDPVLSRRDVEIDADDEAGTVTLHGTVRGAKEVAHAVTLARGVPGVTKVRQRLRVVRQGR
jgi:hypothetical protein